MDPLIASSEFIGLSADDVYLYTGAHAPALRTASEAMAAAHALQSRGAAGRLALLGLEDLARRRLAGLAGCAPGAIALAGDASTLWNSVATGLPWAAGDNVVVNDLEHASVYLPFLAQRRHGLEVRFARHNDDWELPPARILDMCDERTRAIAISSVSYLNSYRPDLSELAALARSAGIPVLVDWSHSLGVTRIDSQLASIGISASYKWLLGPYGVGIVMANPGPEGVEPGIVGWRSTDNMFDEDRFDRLALYPDARRFQVGAAAFASIAAIAASAGRLAEIGLGTVEEHSRKLSALCTKLVIDAGLQLLSPVSEERRGGSVAVVCENAESVADRLAARGVHVWGGDGRIRASFHVMNSSAHVERFVSELRAAVGR